MSETEIMGHMTATSINPTSISFPIETTTKGIKTFIIEMDEFEIIETGTKQKGNVPTAYMKIKIP